ncbi:integrator complex subunit 6-B-like isoform X1 [Styela clava]
MQIVLFIVDNSASMGQRCYLGTRLLDVAKGAVETFIKMRSRDPASRNDRYMLVTLDEIMFSIKAGWKETHAQLIDRLKSLQAEGLTTLGQALRTSFDLLSVNRLVSGIDTYGQGRSPFFLEPAMIIAITDGGKLSNKNGVQTELHLPMNDPLPGSELTKEPFRWDQRLFSLVLRLPATTTQEPEQLGSVPSDRSPISLMCEVTGGRSYSVTSQKTLMQCLDSLVQKVQGGVVVHFECIDPEKRLLNEVRQPNGLIPGKANGGTNSRSVSPNPLSDPSGNNTGWASLHRMIYVRPSPKSGIPIGHWPLPEAFWPDPNAPSLIPRTAHPILRFSSCETEPLLVTNFPYDKYELEPSPLTQVLLEKKNPNTCWQVYVDNSGKYSDNSPPPCGYLKASSNLSCVNLFVMPYNYPVLLPLINKLIKNKMKMIPSLRVELEDYLKMLPSYYIGAVRKAMRQLGVPNLVPDSLEVGLSHSVLSYFKKLKQQAKASADRIMNSVGHIPPYVNKGISISGRYNTLSVTQLPNFNQILASVTENASLMPKVDLNEFPNFHIGVNSGDGMKGRRMYHNAFDVPRSQLLNQVRKMKVNFHRVLSSNQLTRIRLQDKAELHNQPISTMGNYQEYLKKFPQPLRELDPDTPKRLHTFGNPFKLAKEKGMMIDETEDYDAPSSGNKSGRSGDAGKRNRRKRSASPMRPGTPPVFKKSHLSTPGFVNNQTNPAAVVTNHQTTDNHNSLPHAFLNGETRPPNGALELTEPSAIKTTPSDIAAKLQALKSNLKHNMSEMIELEPKLKHSDLLNGKGSDNMSLSDSMGLTNDSVWKTMHRKHKQKKPKSNKATAEIENANSSIKDTVIKFVRKPGKNDINIFNELQKLKGPKSSWHPVLCSVIKEAHRFKKDNLIQHLKKFEETLEKHLASSPQPHKVDR